MIFAFSSIEKQCLPLLEPPGFGDFRKKKTAVFGCLTNALAPPSIALDSCSVAQTDRPQSSRLHLKKNFLLGGCGFFVSDIISGGLFRHLGPLCLALGANR